MGGKRRTGYAEDANGNKKRARGYFIPRVIEVAVEPKRAS
jgi:hypothetical protein